MLIVLLWALCSEVKISRYGTLTMTLDLVEMKTVLIDCPFFLTFPGSNVSDGGTQLHSRTSQCSNEELERKFDEWLNLSFKKNCVEM